MRWISTTINVDIETGEQITNPERDKNYTIIKKIKNVKQYKASDTTRYIEYTNECRRKPTQFSIF